ncbi:MAG: DUF4197 domain-containing protein, partial [Bacteroidota bacterium]
MRIAIIASFTLFLTACSEVNLGALNEILEAPAGESAVLTEAEVGAGLKEALIQGVGNAVTKASAENGFYKNPALFIPFPEEAIKVKETALNLGLNSQVEQFEMTLNRAAEEASKEASAIFVDAVKSMTIEDAFGILNGGKTAATDFLKRKTTASLTAAFSP